VSIDRLAQQIEFVVELDKLKQILRQTVLMDASRRENSAEHSWHLALMATVLAEHTDEPVDVAHAVKMLLIHDIVEIDAGDTFCYDQQGVLDQAEREQRAAERIFGLLPAEQAEELRGLWQEFEARETAEARFAAAMDRIQPLLHNFHTKGGTWAQHGITVLQVQQRMAPVAHSSTRLAEYVQAMIDQAVELGYIKSE
jgi:putative hydrolase of HD superfamily